MPIWGLQIILAVIPLIGKLIDRLVPDKVTKHRDFKSKKKMSDMISRFHGKTIEEIAVWERKRQEKLIERQRVVHCGNSGSNPGQETQSPEQTGLVEGQKEGE